MASLSLPRVLQLKKNSLDAEREQFEKFQTLAIQKAINAQETPVKEKHVRSAIIGTFQEQSAITYWMVAIRLPLQENRIVAWKFCHVTHKLLREGHPACLDDSQRHIAMIDNLAKLWVHLREGYGRLVNVYCNLLVTKLKFHARNPRFPGNMNLTSDELDAIAENDVNNYFQLCVELFDYMDDILTLQEAVFGSLGNARANSMTASGQCRLAALIPCAQDSSHIYDCNVRLLFRLHAALPADTLSGHRERFRQQFKKLSSFYKHASSLQYYRNLLTLPLLPSNPPNFLQQSEFGTYVRPVVSVPEPVDEPDTSALIDTSDTQSQFTPEQEFLESRASPSPQPDQLVERDRLIEHLQNELHRMRSEVSQMVQERNSMLNSMRDHCSKLENELQNTKAVLEEEKQKAETLSTQTPEIQKKLSETEEKAKLTDEKFQKLKGAYTQLREEHIKLIRQKAEVDKTAATLRAAAAEHESAKVSLQQQLSDRMKDVELLQQSASSSEEIEAYKNEIASLRSEIEQSRTQEVQIETLKANMEALQIEHNTAKTEAQEHLNDVINEIKDLKDAFLNLHEEKKEKEIELGKVKEELEGLREKSGEEYKKAVQEKETAQLELASLTQKYHQEKQSLEIRLSHIEKEKINAECELQDLLQHNTVLEENVVALKKELEQAKQEVEKQRSTLISCASATALQVTSDALTALESGSPIDNNKNAADLAARTLDELAACTQLNGKEETVARNAILAAHNTAQLSYYVTDVSNASTDLTVADKLLSDCRAMLSSTKQCLSSLASGRIDCTLSRDTSAKVREVSRTALEADKSHAAARNVDDELADMDRAIEMAATQIEDLLKSSRAADSGIKLEVNGAILDACTGLMGAVREVVRQSRGAQSALGDQTARRHVYRRNPQWSEGLISASKAVVFAAKLLVTSADDTVSGTGRPSNVSMAAHEVAASSAQLVSACRARAPPGPAVQGLVGASRALAGHTAAVVAAVRHAAALTHEQEALDTSALTLTATRRLEMESKVRSLELETALDAERERLAALRKRHYQLAQIEENGNMTNGKGE